MFSRVVEVLKEFTDVHPSQIQPDTELVSDLGLTSLDVVNLVVAFEEEFDIEVSDRALKNFRKVQDLVSYLERETA